MASRRANSLCVGSGAASDTMRSTTTRVASLNSSAWQETELVLENDVETLVQGMESHGRRAPGVQHRAAVLFRIRPSGDEPATIVDPESNAAQFRTLPVAMRATHAFGLLVAQSGARPSQPEEPLRRPRPDRDDRIGKAMVSEQESLPAPPLCRRIDHSRRQRTRISDVDGHLDGEIERAGSGPRVDATTKTHGLPQRPFVRDRHASAVAGELADPYCGGAVNFERIVAAGATRAIQRRPGDRMFHLNGRPIAQGKENAAWPYLPDGIHGAPLCDRLAEHLEEKVFPP